jgi:hypothetical protein
MSKNKPDWEALANASKWMPLPKSIKIKAKDAENKKEVKKYTIWLWKKVYSFILIHNSFLKIRLASILDPKKIIWDVDIVQLLSKEKNKLNSITFPREKVIAMRLTDFILDWFFKYILNYHSITSKFDVYLKQSEQIEIDNALIESRFYDKLKSNCDIKTSNGKIAKCVKDILKISHSWWNENLLENSLIKIWESITNKDWSFALMNTIDKIFSKWDASMKEILRHKMEQLAKDIR